MHWKECVLGSSQFCKHHRLAHETKPLAVSCSLPPQLHACLIFWAPGQMYSTALNSHIVDHIPYMLSTASVFPCLTVPGILTDHSVRSLLSVVTWAMQSFASFNSRSCLSSEGNMGRWLCWLFCWLAWLCYEFFKPLPEELEPFWTGLSVFYLSLLATLGVSGQRAVPVPAEKPWGSGNMHGNACVASCGVYLRIETPWAETHHLPTDFSHLRAL